MNRDPFDSLRSRNPAPPEGLPDAPMDLASRITVGPTSLRRGLAIAGAAAAVVLLAGGGWLLWNRAGGGREVVAPATTTPGTSEVTTTTLLPPDEEAPELVVYFFKDFALIPVARDLSVLNVRPLPDLGPLALELLLWGPGAWDAAPLPDPVAAAEAALTTAIPEGTELRGLTIEAGVATVDLSAPFADASPQAIAQVVYTATRLEGVTEVGFAIEGLPQVIGSITSGLFTPYLEPADTGNGMGSVGREILSFYLPQVMVEAPALGGTLHGGDAIALLARADTADAVLTLTAADGTLLWNALATPDDPAFLPPEVIAGLGGEGAWVTLLVESRGGDGVVNGTAEIPVWLAPYVPPADEPDLPEATTTLPPESTTTVAGEAAPWAQPALEDQDVPALVGDVWAAAEDRDRCAMLFPADVASLADGAVLHERYFAGDWGLAWDLPSGPGRDEPGGEYCSDCGGEAFGIGATWYSLLRGDEDEIWSHRLFWSDGSHAGYGYEGLSATGDRGEPVLAYLFVEGQDCIYNVWSYLGEEHLLALIDQLRFVKGYQGSSQGAPSFLGDFRSFPEDMLTGCAPETARDLASFEAALAEGPISLQDLCELVGMPDYETGSGLFIAVYDLIDAQRLYLGYTAPWGDGLIYANLVSPDGTVRNLLEG